MSERRDPPSGGEGGPLGFDEPADEPRWAHRTDPDMAAGYEPPAPPPKPNTSRYGWVVGIAFLVAVAYITVNTLRTHGQGSRGLAAGQQTPAVAMPLALGSLNGDADVATKPNEGGAGRVPACQERGPEILNVCEEVENGPLVLAFLATRGASRCEDQLDVVQRLVPRFPRVRFAAVAIEGDRGALRTLIRTHGWTFPVGYDHDGAVANLYRVAVCPTINLIARGGVNRQTLIGVQRQDQLSAAIGQQLAAPAR